MHHTPNTIDNEQHAAAYLALILAGDDQGARLLAGTRPVDPERLAHAAIAGLGLYCDPDQAAELMRAYAAGLTAGGALTVLDDEPDADTDGAGS